MPKTWSFPSSARVMEIKSRKTVFSITVVVTPKGMSTRIRGPKGRPQKTFLLRPSDVVRGMQEVRDDNLIEGLHTVYGDMITVTLTPDGYSYD